MKCASASRSLSVSSGTAQYHLRDSRTSFTCSNNSMSYRMFYRSGQKRRLVSVSRMDKICPPLDLVICLRSLLLAGDVASCVTMVFHMFLMASTCGALNVNYGHSRSSTPNDGKSVLRGSTQSRTGLGNNNKFHRCVTICL